MSTDSVTQHLKSLDREINFEEKKLSRTKRFLRHYFTGRTVIATTLASKFGFVKGVFVTSAFYGKSTLALLSVKAPMLASAWGWVAATFEGALVAFHST